MGRQWKIVLPYVVPPLSLNSRMNWQKRARLTAQVKSDVGWLLRAQKVPQLPRIEVALVWTPGTANHRDSDNPEATRKVCVDAIVAAKIVVDDTPQYVIRPEIVINPPSRQPSLVLIITEVETP